MTISEEDKAKKSPIGEALDKGTAKVYGKDRKVIKAIRKTAQGKVNEKNAEELRKKDE